MDLKGSGYGVTSQTLRIEHFNAIAEGVPVFLSPYRVGGKLRESGSLPNIPE